MSRYIDADVLTRRWCGIKCGCEREECGREIEPCIVVAMIEDAPTIDIVRCRECRYCKRKRGTFKGETIIFYRCEEHNRDVENDDYCSYGERREP